MSAMTPRRWDSYRREFGLGYGMSIVFVGLNILAAMSEVLGLGIFLPIFQYVRMEGDLAALTAKTPQWGTLIEYADWVGFPVTLVSLLVVAFLLFFMRQLIMYGRTVLIIRTEQNLVRNLRSRLFGLFLAADLSEQERFAAGDVANTISTEASTAIDGLTAPLKFLSAFFMAVIYLSLLALLSFQMTLIAGVIGVLAVAFIRRWLRRTVDVSRKLTLSNQAASSYLFQRLNFPRLVRLAGTEKAEREGIDRLFAKQAGNTFAMALLKARTEVFLEPIVIGLSLAFLYFAVTYYGWQVESIGLFMVVSLRFIPIVKSITQCWQGVLRGAGPLERVTDTSSMLRAAHEKPGGTKNFPDRSAEIVFDNVSFKYESADRPALHNVSLEVPSGKLTALVGPSGGGKSTLIDLIPRLRDPSEGSISINGTPVAEFLLTSLRAGIAYAPQSPQLFNVKAADHIRYGNADASMEEIQDAARLAGADEFIRNMPKGYDSLVGEGGASLSGGQRQRLDLARALLVRAPVLILDEPTSQQDADIEHDFREALLRIRKETSMTLIVVAHRLSTVAIADQIIVLRDGRIDQSGTHGALLRRGGWYALASEKQRPLDELEIAQTEQV